MLDTNLLSSTAANTGAAAISDVADLQKALEAGYGTDVSTLTGGAALRIQSLDHTMQAVIQENDNFKLFNKLNKTKPTATVDEWTEMNGVGGFIGGSSNTETGTIQDATGSYARRTGLVKYLMTRRQVSFVQTLQGALADAEAVEHTAGSLQLLTDAEHFLFHGDSAVVPTEFDGIGAQMEAGVADGSVDSSSIIDASGAAITSVNAVTEAAAQIAGYGNFGTPTDIYLSQFTQADLDTGLDPAFRVPLTNVAEGGLRLGAPVRGIRTSWGDIANEPDIFIPDENRQKPFDALYPAVAAAQIALKPAAVTVDASVTDASSKFAAAQAGNYYWGVAGLNANGQSGIVVTAQTAVAAGKKAVLSIAASAGGAETGYAIYRGRQNGTNAPGDMRLVRRIAKAAGGTTTYTDYNTDIPGTTKAYILNLKPTATAITWRQLLPMVKFPLAATNSAVIPWAQLLFGYLRISKRRHVAVIKNIVTNKQAWKPFA